VVMDLEKGKEEMIHDRSVIGAKLAERNRE
jgi:hypothetical protein